jgi:hypothetical protein
MPNPDRPAIQIPNIVLILLAVALAAVALWSYTRGDRETATMTIAGSGLFLSALNFSLPAMPALQRLFVVPVLLSPFLILTLLLLHVI